MIDGIRIKVCGLTTIVDADFADKCGVDFLGFIFFPKSPRGISLSTYDAMRFRLPERKRVAVSVEPTNAELTAFKELGFDFFQVHFRHDLPAATISSWAETVGAERLWLAPKLPPTIDVPATMLPLAKHFLLDTFHLDKFGGTGATGDWAKFARHQKAHSDQTWILSGGLNPDNIAEALRSSEARFVDVNSGVEAAPGVKDQEKLKRLVVAVHKARTAATA